MSVRFYTTKKQARAYGCTHTGRFLGIVPGYIEPEQGLWVSVSDLLAPVESVLSFIWANMRLLRGEEPDFMFVVGKEL